MSDPYHTDIPHICITPPNNRQRTFHIIINRSLVSLSLSSLSPKGNLTSRERLKSGTEVDLWASRVPSAKQLSALQAPCLNHHSDNLLNMDGSDGEDDSRAYFPCPFCYVEIELHALCSHLQEEHCFDLKNAVCPLCAANLGKDPIKHFMVQHSHSVKRGKKTQKPGFWSNSPTMLGKGFRELSSFLGSSSLIGRENVHDSAPDPLLSMFTCNMPFSDPIWNQEDGRSRTTAASATSDVPSTVAVKPDEFREEEYEEKLQRAEFFQQLVLSTIF